MMVNVSPESGAPFRSSYPRSMRGVVHGALLLAFLAFGGVGIVWPQWVAADRGHVALDVQEEREVALREQLETARALTGRLRDWKHEERRVFLEEELPLYPALVREVARDAGAAVVSVETSDRTLNRWRPLRVPSASLDPMDDEELGPSEEIRPQSVHLVLTGAFGAVYRTVAALGQQQQLCVPERWDVSSRARQGGGRELKAEIWATVFVVKSTEATLRVAAAGGAQDGEE